MNEKTRDGTASNLTKWVRTQISDTRSLSKKGPGSEDEELPTFIITQLSEYITELLNLKQAVVPSTADDKAGKHTV